MIEVYALISAFMFGVYVGAAYERNEKPDLLDYPKLILLSVLWPVVIGMLLWVAANRER